ncbi:MAG: ATP-binding protein [Eubacteriales bacterium]|nr:ATP-binding protein [Eubacteriales bacterium]MDD3571510.1 ATP-binding protein [Eubacteriales bacterium]MDD4134059.1 ATP-binding protein [Eubacteriales bacterium]NLO12602.1 ATP-binding protein [Clostridiales bacterium]
MANEALTQALTECRARQYENQREEQERLRKAIALQPRIGELADDRREDILRGLRLAMEGINPEGVQERTRERNLKIRELLKAAGLPEDYLSPVFQCHQCQDSGYVGEAPKALCQCVIRRYHALLSGGLDLKDGPSFTRFDLSVFPEAPLGDSGTTQRLLMKTFKAQGEEYAAGVAKGQGKLNLLLHGPSGLGKSYLLRCVAKEAADHGVVTLTMSANALINHIRQVYFNLNHDSLDQPYYDVPLLLIDDLGIEPKWEGITIEQLFALLEHRINHKKPTAISTNLSPMEIQARYSERISSRLFDRSLSLVLPFQGKDIRLIRR